MEQRKKPNHILFAAFFAATMVYLELVFRVATGGSIFSLGFIYTLFFALPFEETYVAQEAHKTYDKKMYALCRHPGVLWFAGFYICLWLAFGTKPLLVMAIWFSLLNFCCIVLQDKYSYPKVFSDYGDYQKRVPFLIPNGKSLKRCLDTFKESR